MKPREATAVLPHELCFGVFQLLVWGRLVLATGGRSIHVWTYLALIGVSTALIAACIRKETPLRWRLRLLYYPIAMNALFLGMGPVVTVFHPGREDALLQRIDGVLVGTNLSLRMDSLVHPALTEVLSLCYLLFFPYLAFSFIYYFLGDLETLKKFCAGLFTIYGIGFIGYTLLPAVGPYVAMDGQFSHSLDGGAITRWNAALVHAGSNGVDVFPSLHCAVSSYILFFDLRHKRWRFWTYLVPCIGLWISTIYLRYHYAVDLLAGFSLSATALWLASRFPRKDNAHGLPAAV
jgi:hypothetical protein